MAVRVDWATRFRQDVPRSRCRVVVSFFIGFCLLLYAQRWMPVTRTGRLPFFIGISMTLGVYFAEGFFRPFGAQVADINPIVLPAVAGVGAILAGLLGAFLGWLNVTILFPLPAR